MKKLLLSLLCLTSTALFAAEPISFATSEGRRMLLEADYRCDYWLLTRYFDTQATNTYCGVASTIMALNALEMPKPPVERFGNKQLWVQEHFFNDATKEIVAPEEINRRGIRFHELQKVLETFGLEAQAHPGDQIDPNEFRSLIKQMLRKKDFIVLANYYRPAVGQSGGGHWSPLAAYNEREDSILILDVSRFNYPPVWVKVDTLLESMGTQDRGAGNPRGFLVVSRAT